MTIIDCYCGSLDRYSQCCEEYIKGVIKAPTAEKLMRSRYAAYARQEAGYLVATTHPSERKYHSKEDILEWARSNDWQKLEVIKSTDNTVEFKAYFTDSFGKNQIHHELSTFKFENGSWFYVDGTFY
jgi:SEC-C motif-containing protein